MVLAAVLQCHITIDLNTPPIPTDSATLLAAATAVDSTTKLCWLGGTMLVNDPGFGTITETFVNFQVYTVPGACTEADRTIGLAFLANQTILASNGTITEATFQWDDDCTAPAPGGACTCYPCGSQVPTTSFGGCGPPNPIDCSATAGNPTAGCWDHGCGPAGDCQCATGTCQQ